MTATIQPIDPVNLDFFAAEVSGIDLTRPLSDAEVAAKLPILFRTLRSKPLTKDKLEKLIESIRKA